MKRLFFVFSLAICILAAGQTASLAETVTVTSSDDPGYYGGIVTVPLTDNWATNPSFMSGDGLMPVPLTAEESATAVTKDQSVLAALAADEASNTGLYGILAATPESTESSSAASLGGTTSTKSPAEDQPTFTTKYPPYYIYTYFAIPNYNQGRTPYCGPFSALQILRYRRYSEPSLLANLIKEMYVSGQGTNIYKLAGSLRKRLRYAYYASPVLSSAHYAYMHARTVGVDRMPIDNLVRIYAGKLGRYRQYHGGHFIDSNGYYFSLYRPAHYVYVTDTYQEYVNGIASGTLGPQWVSFFQMYRAITYHPRRSVVW